jgi:hypothetical protein
MHSWLGHQSITGTAVHTALAANRFKDFWGELAKALKIGRGVGLCGCWVNPRPESERELGKLVEVAVSSGTGRHTCRRRPDDRGKTLAAASVEMPPYGEPLRNAPTAPALMWERPARGWSLLPQNGDYK